MQQPQQWFDLGRQLLQRMTLDPGDDAGDEPTRLAHLDHRDQRAILIESGERAAQVIGIWLQHGAPRRFVCSDDGAIPSPLAP
jgi:hypothetical protein